MNSLSLRSLMTRAMLFASALLLLTTRVSAQEFRIVVNASNATTELTSDAAAKLFLKQVTKFPNGVPAQPVDQGKANPTRAAFSRAILGRPVNAVEAYWQQAIFSGKDVPPPTKSSDDDVIAYVKGNPGAIGYVSAGATVSGVKVVTVH